MTSLLERRTSGSPVTAHPVPAPGRTTLRRWQHQYSHRLRISDSLIVCGSVMLAQYVRFGDSPNTSGYPGAVMTLFSFLFAALWLSSLAIFRTQINARHRSRYRRVPADRQRVILDIRNHRDGDATRQVRPGPGLSGGCASRRHYRIADKPQHVAQVYLPQASARRIPDDGIGDWRPAKKLHALCGNWTVIRGTVMSSSVPAYPDSGLPRGDNLTVEGHKVPILGDDFHVLAAIDGCGADAVVVTQNGGLRRDRDQKLDVAVGNDGRGPGDWAGGVGRRGSAIDAAAHRWIPSAACRKTAIHGGSALFKNGPLTSVSRWRLSSWHRHFSLQRLSLSS